MSQKSFKFIPNLFGVFANSPVLLEGYVGLEKTFDKGSLSAVERQIILLSASVENSCGYCMAAHSTLLKAFMHVPAEVVSAVRANQPVSDPKLEALVALTKEIVRERGHPHLTLLDSIASFRILVRWFPKVLKSSLTQRGRELHTGTDMRATARQRHLAVKRASLTSAPGRPLSITVQCTR
jgi:AhpD family alkylhydroperoxidase